MVSMYVQQTKSPDKQWYSIKNKTESGPHAWQEILQLNANNAKAFTRLEGFTIWLPVALIQSLAG